MKRIMVVLLGLILILGLFGCNSQNNAGASAGAVAGATELKLAHNLAEDHPVHKALEEFAKEVETKTDGKVVIKIFANGQLGDERGVLEQLKIGAVDMTKVNSASLENFSPVYKAFTLPYMFENLEHFYAVMDGEIAEEIYESSKNEGFSGLTYYDSGARSFYTKTKPITTLEDLKGLKIRVMDNPSSIRMMELLGAQATPLPYGDIYTSLSAGVIDGAESNETALTLGKHGEICKFFSYDEHTRIPDFLVISNKAWDKIPSEYHQIIKDAAKASTEYQKEIWAEALKQAKTDAEAMGVAFNEVDKAPFKAAVAPMYDELKGAHPEVYGIVEKILALAPEKG